MKVLIFALSFISNTVSAQIWDYLITSSSGIAYFIDPASINMKGDLVNYTQLINYPKGYDSGNQNIHSIQQVKQIDCKNNLIRTISMIAYEHENAKGNIQTLSIGREYQSLKVNENSISGLYKDQVCIYKK
jgi:hypothetical protein